MKSLKIISNDSTYLSIGSVEQRKKLKNSLLLLLNSMKEKEHSKYDTLPNVYEKF